MALPKIGLEAILQLGNFNRGVKTYTQGVSGMEKSTDAAGKGVSGFGSKLDKLGGGFTSMIPGIAGATAAFFALKKVYDFGKEGAAIAQTKDSFDRLMDSMGVAPSILQQMSNATLNTVDDMTLMSSTMTLVAGVSERLGRAMVDAAPKLLEVAKAAVKLKPSLGSVAQVYDSVALGIKRNSPLLIDNANIIVKVGAANEKMAAKLGKSVEALTAEDKQMALLEATLVAGDRMIEQVGGSVEAMGDEFAQAEVKIKNAGDAIKASLAPAIADATSGIAKFIDEIAIGFIFLGGVLDGTLSIADYFAAGMATNTIYMELGAVAAREYAAAVMESGDAMTQLQFVLGKETARISAKWEEYAVALRDNVKATEELGVAQYEATITTDDLARAQKALDDVIKDIRKSYESFFGSLSQGIVKYRELGDAQTQSAKDYAKTIAGLNQDAKKAYNDVQENFKASLPDATTVADRLGMAGDAWDEWGLRIQAIIEGGVTNEWYAALQEMGYSKPPDVGLVEWLEGLKTKFYEGKLPDLLPPEWAENVKTQQEAATATVQAESAKRRAAAKAERDAQLAEEQAARDRATVELALTLAENSKQLEEWSKQRFGEDMFGIADTAKEVLGLLDSGMLDIDAALQEIITNSVVGVQTALDTTGQQAGETAKLLDELVSPEFIAEKQAEIQAALDLGAAETAASSSMVAIGATIVEAVPKTAFDVMLENFDGVSASIVTQATLMGLDLAGTFNTIDLDWAAMVGSQVRSWDEGMGEVQKAIQEKVIEKLDEIPTKIVVTVTTEQEGGAPEGKQSGGPVLGGVPYVVGEAGPELFVPSSPGTIIPNMDLGMNLPGMLGAGVGGTSFGPTITLNMSPTINNGMDLAEFQALTLMTVQQAIRGA